jgi:hypothetical protein
VSFDRSVAVYTQFGALAKGDRRRPRSGDAHSEEEYHREPVGIELP